MPSIGVSVAMTSGISSASMRSSSGLSSGFIARYSGDAVSPYISGATSCPPVTRMPSHRATNWRITSGSSVNGSMTGVPPDSVMPSMYPGSIHRLSSL